MNETPAFDHRAFLRTLTTRPGVYRMLDASGEVIYVGKARNLRRRVASYFRTRLDSPKTRVMVAQVRDIQVTVTRNEAEALLLENNLIKSLRPRYNVTYRDDKSYPWIYLSDGEFPRFAFHRGARTGRGRYFGPYPSAAAVRETLNLLQKVFPVRQCEDSVFRNRSRPCLQHQIGRCTAPCVGRVSPERYAEDVRHAVMFLEGRSTQVIDELVAEMEAAAAALEYEHAARCRDRITALRRVRERQYVTGAGGQDVDVVAAHVEADAACVQVFQIRGGRNLGNRAFFPRNPEQLDAAGLLAAFLPQYYLAGDGGMQRQVPPLVLTRPAVAEAGWLEAALAGAAGRAVAVRGASRGEKARWLELAATNARAALAAHLASRATVGRRLEALARALGLAEPPARLECFDVSHTRGEATVAACVVFDASGPVKSDYRRYNIEGVEPGDDYAALRQALARRYRRVQAEDGVLPDLLLIDGGPGQLRQALEVLAELELGGLPVVAIAKGPARRPGEETLHVVGAGGALPLTADPLILPPDSPALHLLQQVRDEAHRFAITGHRQRRARRRRRSPLEDIPGLGPKRRQRLLRQLGGLQEVARAGVEELASVEGISRRLAERIYQHLHAD